MEGLCIVLYFHMNECVFVCVCVCVCVFVWGCWGGVLRIIALQSFLDHPSGALMSLVGLWVLLFPTEWKGASYFFHSLFTLWPESPPLHSKAFIDYLSLLLNNLILGDSALYSHRN